MPDESAIDHIAIPRLKELAEEPVANPADTAEAAHLAVCEHCQHIVDFFSDEYIGKRLLKEDQIKPADIDKPA